MIVFPYKRDAKGNYFPVVELTLTFHKKSFKFLAIIDSGATISVFRDGVAEQLGVNIESGEKTTLGGVGGRIIGYIHKVKIKIADEEFICPIVFSREYLVSFNLLGREEFFKRFKIIFEEKKNLLKLE